MQDLILTAIGAFVGCMVGELLSKRKKPLEKSKKVLKKGEKTSKTSKKSNEKDFFHYGYCYCADDAFYRVFFL